MAHVVLAGGGTAGHTSPLIATAERIAEQNPSGTLVAVGTARGLETTVVPAAGLRLELIPPVPLPRKPTPELLAVPWRLIDAVRQARRILQAEAAQVAVGFGGYVSLPVYLAARSLGIPVVIHEQNALPGLANKVAARFAAVVGVSFPDTPLANARYLGLPVRRGIAELNVDQRRGPARAAFGLDPDRPTLLVSGGSQGAQSINQATAGARDRLLAAGIQVLHVLGPKNITEADTVLTDSVSGARYVPLGYVDAMEDAYAAADLMVGRAGAGTVMETATVGLPVVFVPLPHGNGEQARNAGFLVAGGAGLLIDNADFSADRMATEVLGLFADPARLPAMRAATRDLVPADAAGRLATLVLATAKGA
ncbi:undecaprenyldiphospho-muramoylpentapeptide beta-N-acetylglucosaminyltransferase [Micropruina sp.]|uniref:undecaprenyldiphospho-muramoylpentapeptide beta-N-acetylglucosaminyltransferase n=1 Tax=Micropruina sp. TaxID=2737536 RepID=UPI0039E3C9AB